MELVVPNEDHPHELTFMTFPEVQPWHAGKSPFVQLNVVKLAKVISRFEPVTLIVSPESIKTAQQMIGSSETKINILECEAEDLWARDHFPVFMLNKNASTGEVNGIVGVDLNFNYWGNKHPNRNGADTKISKRIIEEFGFRQLPTWLVGEGGGLEFDGHGTLMANRSSWINPNRNPKRNESEITSELKKLFNLHRIIWFNGIAGEDVTDAHIDTTVRFINENRVILSKPNPKSSHIKDVWAKVSHEIDTLLKQDYPDIKIVEVFEPDRKILKTEKYPHYFATYANYYVVNGGVIIPKFGDEEADEDAKRIFEAEFPDREIVAVEIPWIAPGGGGIHCATHELPASINFKN